MTLDLGAGVVELTRQLCDLESVSGDERRLADEIEAAVTALDHLKVFRDGDCVVARTELGRARRVVIAGHIDTVPVNGNLPCRLEPVDGAEYLWGRGTVDMKAGIAVQLAVAAAVTDPAFDLAWIWYDHEEVDAALNGLGRLSRNRPDLIEGDFAVLGEPTAGVVEGGCNGTLRVDVTVRGVRAHSARPWAGENAIHKAAGILGTLAAYRPEEVEVDGLAYRESLNAVMVSGGVAKNVIPDECVLHVNYRFAPSRTGEEALRRVTELFPEAEVTVADLSEGARPGLDTPVAREFIAAVGGEPKPKYGWTDVARFSALGVPAVNFGPGDPSLAHADDERVATAEIEACEAALRAWLTGRG